MHILIVDDDPSLSKSLVRIAETLGHSSVVATNAWEAFDAIEAGTFDAIITDVQMPGGNGIELLQILGRLAITLPTYVHSSESTFYFQRQQIELASHIPKVFGGHISFRLKDGNMFQNITAFLKSMNTP